MRRRAQRFAVLRLLSLFVVLVGLVGCGGPGPAAVSVPWDRPSVPAGLSLRDVHDIGELRDVFNQDAGKPRLILLVSPT